MSTRKQFTPEEHKRIQAFIQDGCPAYEIARTLGVNPKRLMRDYPESKVPATERGTIGQLIRRFNTIPDRLERTPVPYGR